LAAPQAHTDPSVAPAIYGQILATALVATLSEDGSISAGELLFWFAVTMLVFWFAHVYAEAVAERFRRDRSLTWRDVRQVAKRESPELTSALPALVILALGGVHVLTREAAADLAIGLGVVALFAWGFVIARRSGLSPLATAGAVAVNGAFGLAIVALKVLID
jgi:hypothetical protein